MRAQAVLVSMVLLGALLAAAAPSMADAVDGVALVLAPPVWAQRCYMFLAAGVAEFWIENNGAMTGGVPTPTGEGSGLQRVAVGSTPSDHRASIQLWTGRCAPSGVQPGLVDACATAPQVCAPPPDACTLVPAACQSPPPPACAPLPGCVVPAPPPCILYVAGCLVPPPLVVPPLTPCAPLPACAVPPAPSPAYCDYPLYAVAPLYGMWPQPALVSGVFLVVFACYNVVGLVRFWPCAFLINHDPTGQGISPLMGLQDRCYGALFDATRAFTQP